MTTATEQTDRIFMESVLADDAGGYPDGVSFVARDFDGWEGLVWNPVSLTRSQLAAIEPRATSLA